MSVFTVCVAEDMVGIVHTVENCAAAFRAPVVTSCKAGFRLTTLMVSIFCRRNLRQQSLSSSRSHSSDQRSPEPEL